MSFSAIAKKGGRASAVKAKLTSWSYSRYGTYKTCPLKAKLSYIDKLPITKNAAMERGAQIHEEAEQMLKGMKKTVPKNLALFAPHFKDMKKIREKEPERVIVEETWAFRSDWTRTTWNDWNGCALRIKLDLCYVDNNRKLNRPVIHVVDYKTGKFKPDNLGDYIEQLDLYGLGALLVFADTFEDFEVRPKLMYLDEGVVYPREGIDDEIVYEKKDLARLKKEWEKRVKPLLNDTTFAPKPNRFCAWCDYSAAKGGPCKY